MIVRHKGICDYVALSHDMRLFTEKRDANSDDECWLLQHFPVYTQGTSCQQTPQSEQVNIPLIKSNRGGQITYHAPGQIIVYCLFDIKRMGIGPRRLVKKCQDLIITFLQQYKIQAKTQQSAPGVYIDDKKIASLGFRITRGRCYHGFAINVDMDLTPFDWIDPCGYKGLQVTQLADYATYVQMSVVSNQITTLLERYFKH